MSGRLLILAPILLLTMAAAGPIRFEEVASKRGVTFRHRHGGSGEFYMPETMGSGVVVFDYDGDGDQDLLFVDSGALSSEGIVPGVSALFRNDGEAFLEVTERTGIAMAGYGMGGVAGDIDGDGDLDLYLTAFGPDQLFRNHGDGTFSEVRGQAGFHNPSWGASATFCDPDLDGDLDLYVANYLDFTVADNEICGLEQRRLRSYCHPDVYEGVADRYFQNRGDGTFEEATHAAGLAGTEGKGLGVVCGHVDDDGWPDLYVANDMTANLLFRNLGGGRFEEVGQIAGAAFDSRGDPEAGMGVVLGDLEGDGHSDLVVTHLDRQTNAVYGNLGSWVFVDRRFTSRLAEPSVYLVGFGVVLGDFDHDADPDLAIANGHIIHNIEDWGRGTTYAQPDQIFENLGGGRFREVEGAGLEEPMVSRGLAAGDLDGDGDLDLAVSTSNGPVGVYENLVGSASGTWLLVELAAEVGNRRAIGALVGVEAGGRRQRREVQTGGSYLSHGALAAHFGFGEGEVVRLRVRWPDGTRQRIEALPAAHRILVRRADPSDPGE